MLGKIQVKLILVLVLEMPPRCVTNFYHLSLVRNWCWCLTCNGRVQCLECFLVSYFSGFIYLFLFWSIGVFNSEDFVSSFFLINQGSQLWREYCLSGFLSRLPPQQMFLGLWCCSLLLKSLWLKYYFRLLKKTRYIIIIAYTPLVIYWKF